MAIVLRGDNLGERHRYLNSLVQDAYKNSRPELLVDLPEATPVDKLFKIDLASKYRNVEYILGALKHDDMLYVSRALKCTWLLEPKYQDIINPEYLESKLYPHMITPAVNKMKHWLQNNLRDPQRCQAFYKYYSSAYNMKIKFLRRCAPEFITAEFLNIVNSVTPKQLKTLCEHCPQVLKLYYDNFANNSGALQNYLRNDREYFKCWIHVLRADPDAYFAILERYYDHNRFGALSSAVTEYVMLEHRHRFVGKPELYAARVLDKNTLARHLNSEEIKELVVKLARAEYLDQWFSYKSVEPFIKRLSAEERSAFKKKVFVDKDIGDKVKDWPYPQPSRPEIKNLGSVFEDVKHHPGEYKIFEQRLFTRCIKKRKGERFECPMICRMDCPVVSRKTKLDELFDRYRFYSFERTMFELRKLLAAESSVKNREFMMLVLVSKCGVNMEQVEKLLRFLAERHYNEPNNLRATIVRSLVVRACVWRLPSEAWSVLLQFGRDLGLGGGQPLTCREGMHAAVLRMLLSGEECPEDLCAAYFDNFSALTEYKLNGAELHTVQARLPAMLTASAAAAPAPRLAQRRVHILLQALSELKVRVSSCPGAVDAVVAAVRRDPAAAADLLPRVYAMRVARRQLFRENFASFQTNESYMNVLRHDAALLKATDAFEKSLKGHSFNFDGYLKKLSVYFGEENGLAAAHRDAAAGVAAGDPRACLARPLALLRPGHRYLRALLDECSAEPKGSPKRHFGAALQSNYHLSDVLDVDTTDWRSIGVKAVANRVLTCREVELRKYVEKSLEWRRALKLALLLAERGSELTRVFELVAAVRPAAAVRLALSYYRRSKTDVGKELWHAVAPALAKIDLSIEQRRRLSSSLEEAEFVPSDVQARYWSDVYDAFRRVSEKKAMPVLCRLENLLPQVDPAVVRKVIREFLAEFTYDIVSDGGFKFEKSYCMRSRIVAKYLLLSGTAAEQSERLDGAWSPFHERLAAVLRRSAECAEPYLRAFVGALKYHEAFFDARAPCLPVLERIVADLRKSLPMEGFFRVFVSLHATMLYNNSIDRCLGERPGCYGDARSPRERWAPAVGRLFGRYVGVEVHELAARYFPSVVTLYEDALLALMQAQLQFDANGAGFASAFLDGLVEAGTGEALRVALRLLRARPGAVHERARLLPVLARADHVDVKFFLHADLDLVPPPTLRPVCG